MTENKKQENDIQKHRIEDFLKTLRNGCMAENLLDE